jgi:hypothetical protein
MAAEIINEKTPIVINPGFSVFRSEDTRKNNKIIAKLRRIAIATFRRIVFM